jgi:hypothetical protein
MTGRYLSCAETAKLIRKVLKDNFPGVKFSVRSHTYSMGASIDVRWTGGPSAKAVDEKVAAFAGGGFDGSIDMKYDVSSWLLPDGSVQFAKSGGTEGSRGTVPAFDNAKPHPDAELVDFASDYVFLHRDPTPGKPPAHDCNEHQAIHGWDGWTCSICREYAEPLVAVEAVR